MIRAMYTAASGMIAESLRVDLMASNLANVSTTGFKGAGVVRGSQRPTYASLATDVQTGYVGQYADQTPGSLRPTGVTMDFALDGEGFFEVQTPGGPAYTRNGHFHAEPDGSVKDVRGNRVMGENGPLMLPPGAQVLVAGDGTVSADGKVVDKLSLKNFPDARTLRTAAGGLFYGPPGATPEAAQPYVAQETLEDSNVSPMAEMAHMVETLRAFESYQKVITTVMDDVTGAAVRQLGRLA
jgi:flagellar basal-body rod protein FlgF